MERPNRMSFKISDAKAWKPFFTSAFPNPGLPTVQVSITSNIVLLDQHVIKSDSHLSYSRYSAPYCILFIHVLYNSVMYGQHFTIVKHAMLRIKRKTENLELILVITSHYLLA